MKKKLLVSLASALGLVLALELCARVAGYGPDASVIQWESHPDLLWRPVPSQDTFFGKEDPATGERRLPIRINRHGQRGPDYPLEKPAGERRVICVGDSLTFGPGVRDEETFLARLQALLGAPDQSGVRVVNAAGNGYATLHYQRHAELQLARYDPDVYVVAVFVGNDMELVGDDSPVLPRWVETLRRRSALANYLRERMRASWVERRADRLGTSVEEVEAELLRYAGVLAEDLSPEGFRDLWLNSLAHLEAAERAAEAAGCEMVVLLLPSHSVANEERESGDFLMWTWLLAELEQRGLRAIDPLAEVAPIAGAERLWLAFDRGHYTPEGHAAVAAALRRGLSEFGLLD